MTPPDPKLYEKLGAFYLGRVRDVAAGRTTDEPLLLDSRELTTHAICVGMTGSGKTGLCIGLLEEAAIDGVPCIAIDPKGDLGNMLLTFPSLRGEEYRPWIDEAEAAREGRSPEEHAEAVAARWREMLAASGQDGERVERLRRSAEVVLFTPGSSAGRPLSILQSLKAPPAAVAADADASRERLQSTVSGLLALAGIEADPLRSREHVLIATILDGAWREGRDLDLGMLIAEIQRPGFRQVGVVDVDAFYPPKERFELAMALNALAASPGFAAWRAGEPLRVAELLRSPDGRPRVSILSIAHLSDAERMFFVTILLQEIVDWMRSQPGTGSLRALLFMDEVFGYLPPTANPPSKTPLLTLLKQARAFGLGVVLATQNPVDLDYKALSNAGTWLVGRLQTERDKLRLMDGLEGASAAAGRAFDRGATEALISGLGKRLFLLQSAHHDEPAVLETRCTLSYLRGPLTRPQIQALTRRSAAPLPQPVPPAPQSAPAIPHGARPVLPPGVPECFLAATPAMTDAGAGAGAPGGGIVYRPRLLARARLHHVAAKDGVDAWRDLALLVPLSGDEPAWAEGDELASVALAPQPEASARFEPLPGPVSARTLAAWTRSLERHLQASAPLSLLRCDALQATSAPGESEAAFRGRLAHASRERRDEDVLKLRGRHGARIARLQERLRKAEQRVEVQRDQASQQRTSAMLSAGGAILGALFGRRGIGGAATAARGFGRASQEGRDVERAAEDVQAAKAELARAEEEIAAEIQEIEGALAPATLVVDEIRVPPRKSDIACSLSLCWNPWAAGAEGLLRPAFEI